MANNFRVRDLIADNVYISENNGNVVNTFGDQLILGDKIFSGSNLFTGDSVSIETTGLNNFGLNSSENNFGSNSSGNYFGSNSSGNYFGLSGDNKYHSGEFIGDFVFDSIPKISGSIFVTDFVTTTRNQTISGQKTFTSIPQVSGFSCIIDDRNYIPSLTGNIKNLFYSLNPYSKSEFIVNSYSPDVSFLTGDLQILTPTIEIHNVGGNSWNVYYGGSPPSTLISIKPLTSASFFLWKSDTNTPLQVYNYTETEIRYDQLGVLKASEAVNALYDQTITGIKNFKSRPTVNGTGVMLNGEAAQLPTTLVYTTGNQDISGIKNFTSLPTVNNTGVYLNSNPSGFITTSQTGQFYSSNNPSGYAATGYVTGISGGLQTQISTLNNATGSYVLNSQTGQFYPNSNPSGYIRSLLTSRTIYVDSSVGTDTRTSLSQYDMSKPFTTISGAAAASATGDLIYVRAGTYAINSQINLNNEGSLYFEPGATVNITNNVTGFSFNQATNAFPTGNSIRIQGHADFVLTGSAGILTIPDSINTSSPPIVAFECNSITGPNAANGTLFNTVNGVLSVDAKTIAMTTTFTASNATVFNITGTADVTARIPFVYCGRFVNGSGTAFPGDAVRAQINADIWTLATYNPVAGMSLRLITTNFRIVNYNHVGVGAAFNWTENTTFESHVFQGVTWSSAIGAAQMTFTSTGGSTTNKRVSLYQTNILRAAATNSLGSTLPIDVYTYGSFATAPAHSNITFKVGAFTVDASA
jgi:hypothetical protein